MDGGSECVMNILKELRECKAELQELRAKRSEDEIWKRIIENFLLSYLGCDVQKTFRDKVAVITGPSTTSHWNRRQVENHTTNRKSSLSASPLGIIASNLRVCPDGNVSIYSYGRASTSQADPDAPPLRKKSFAISDTGIARTKEVSQEKRLINDTRKNRKSSSPSQTSSIAENADGTNDEDDGEDNGDVMVWSDTPTFPLSDINKAIEKSHVQSNDEEDEQDDQSGDQNSQNRTENLDFCEMSFQEVERRIREVQPDGRRGKLFECTICHKALTQRQNARLHVRRVHFGERLKCVGCGRGFYDRRTLSNHKASCIRFMKWLDDRNKGTDNNSKHQPLGGHLQSGGEVEENSSSEMLQRKKFQLPYVVHTVPSNDADKEQMSSSSATARMQNENEQSNESAFDLTSDKIMVVEIAPELFSFDDQQS